jgi:hypothetical protein
MHGFGVIFFCITSLLNRVTGSKLIRKDTQIDAQTENGYHISLTFRFEEDTLKLYG